MLLFNTPKLVVEYTYKSLSKKTSRIATEKRKQKKKKKREKKRTNWKLKSFFILGFFPLHRTSMNYELKALHVLYNVERINRFVFQSFYACSNFHLFFPIYFTLRQIRSELSFFGYLEHFLTSTLRLLLRTDTQTHAIQSQLISIC